MGIQRPLFSKDGTPNCRVLIKCPKHNFLKFFIIAEVGFHIEVNHPHIRHHNLALFLPRQAYVVPY